MQYVAAFRPECESRDGPESSIAYQYVDDGALIEPWVGLMPWLAVSLWECGLTGCLCYKALNRKKREVEGNASTKFSPLGYSSMREVGNFFFTSRQG